MKNPILYLVVWFGLAVSALLTWWLGSLIWTVLHAITWREFITPVKRGFYSACMVAIFFYTARAIRAVARYFEAKRDQITED